MDNSPCTAAGNRALRHRVFPHVDEIKYYVRCGPVAGAEEELTALSCGAGEDCYEYRGLQDELTNQLLDKLKLPTR